MRPLLKFGVPLAGGLAAGGYALSQGEDPGSAALAGLAGGVGAAGGLLAARQLAGKYAPDIRKALTEGGESVAEKLETMRGNLPTEREGGLRSKLLSSLGNKALNVGVAAEGPGFERMLQKAAGSALVPGAAGLAGLGGVAAGAIPGALGVPGFQPSVVDPESYGSSNSPGARSKVPTMQYT
jgi:hypothetical protein